MAIDFWGLGLQSVNVLLLVWLLSRVLWRPVAQAIAKREDAARAIISDAKATEAESVKVLAEVTEARAGLAAERDALLAEAEAKAEAAKRAKLTEARQQAEKLVQAAEVARETEADAMRKENAAKSAELAVEIARKLLGRPDAAMVQTAFLSLMIDAIEQMPPNDRAALVGPATGIDLVSAIDLTDDEKARITEAFHQTFGGEPRLTFVTDADLLAGFELRTAHFSLHNSWRADLERILKDVKDAA